MKIPFKRCLDWIDSHPRTGWYTASMVTIGVLIQLIDLFH